MSCSSIMFGSEFSKEEISRTKAAHGLLTMEIEVGTACNFLCRYCYVGDQSKAGELSPDEMKDVILQAKVLGARKIILLGGEPMLYPFTVDLCEWIRQQGMGVELFTNGSNMTAETASRLFKWGVHVVLKWHSSDARIQNWLSGVESASVTIETAYRNLRAAGFPSKESHFALSTVICRQNIGELPDLWRWMRNEGIEPYFEMITPQGRARTNEHELLPGGEETRRLFETIQAMDRDLFGRVWEAQPPLMGNVCLRHAFSCLVSAKGDVMPCVGVSLPVGNIRRQLLAAILSESEVIADLRNHDKTIQGACGQCEKSESCYGCRGAAFQMTGNYLGSDPLCWHNQDAEDLGHFPIPAERLVPHRAPALLVEALSDIGERTATVTAVISGKSPHCREGRLTEAAHIEVMAQAAAAFHGYRTQARHDGVPQKGMLVGARDFELFEPVFAGDSLTILMHKEARFGTFGVLKAEIRRDGIPVSKAELKTWYAEQD